MELMLDMVSGTIIFISGVSVGQCVQRALHVSASTPFLSPSFGLVSIAGSSVATLAYASYPRQYYYTKHVEPVYMDTKRMVSVSLVGLGLFRVAGGRLISTSPSDFRNIGAFNRFQATLPASAEYADTAGRSMISAFGRIFGCHTCGVKQGSFHADHMPPSSFTKKANASIIRKYIVLNQITQRFYPQCSSCSNQQGMLVQKNTKKLKMHLHVFRTYHFTGTWLTSIYYSDLIEKNKQASTYSLLF